MSTAVLWALAAGWVAGLVTTFMFNRQVLRAIHAMEEARAHYAAMVSRWSEFFAMLRSLTVYALALALGIVAGAFVLYQVTWGGGF